MGSARQSGLGFMPVASGHTLSQRSMEGSIKGSGFRGVNIIPLALPLTCPAVNGKVNGRIAVPRTLPLTLPLTDGKVNGGAHGARILPLTLPLTCPGLNGRVVDGSVGLESFRAPGSVAEYSTGSRPGPCVSRGILLSCPPMVPVSFCGE